MEYNANGIAEWLFEAEQDFTFGAKAATCLHPATIQNAATSSSPFELPDWMETRDNLGLTNDGLFEDVMLPNNFKELPSTTTQVLAYGMEEEDYSNTIKPEDMLVPLSELQPQESTAQRISVPVSEPPKITINVKKVIVLPTSAMKNKTVTNFNIPKASSNVQMNPAVPPQKTQLAQPDNQDSSLAEADDLLDEWMKIVGNEPHLEELDSSVVEDFQDLLSQLETPDSQLDASDVSSWGSEPASPVSLPSPVPSCGSVSPAQSNNDVSFLNIYSPKSEKSGAGASPYAVSDVTWSPSEASFGVPPSPLTIDKTALSPADATPFVEEDWNRSELHSYSRSPTKRKSRKASARVAPYPENKRERKKEQNKQAALRYRQKKKQEDDEIMVQITAEEERQKELQAKYKNLKQELTCMKKILREVFIATGVVSADAFKKK
ncbi:uncharacterized protein LOC125036675 [Penaeus chinensis]|uniref:uncharacterized protein LOC125036675 n=1 Tax=Penaeus chinensis TaxID=139456 RepID=UPI001FB7FF5A|nr:uncharacterized protein LOC125036675 [Penaeus chinensis]